MNCFCKCICEYFLGPMDGQAAPDPLVGGAPRTFGGPGYSSPVTIDAEPVEYPHATSYGIKPGLEASISKTRLAPIPTDYATNQPLADGERLASRAVRLPKWNTQWIGNYGLLTIDSTMKPPLALPQYSYAEVDVNALVDRERLRMAQAIYGNDSLG